MKGSIEKYFTKGSSRPKWCYRLRLGRANDGKYRRESKGGFAKESDARSAMNARILGVNENGVTPAPPKLVEITLGEWLTKWIDVYAVRKCQRKTTERYKQLALYVTEKPELAALASQPLSQVKHAALEAALYALLAAKAKRRKHISPRTVRHVAGLLSVALNKAFTLDYITVNPMLKVELPSIEPKEAESFTPDQARVLREVCRGDWTFILVEMALATGARRGELLALQWSDVDWITNTLTRRVPSPIGPDYRTDLDLIFANPDGTPLKPDSVSARRLSGTR